MSSPRTFKWKQCLVLREDIKMSCGKMCAQAAHAAVASYERSDVASRRAWLMEGQKKVVLRVKDERSLHELRSLAQSKGIPAAIIQDAGLTELPPGTVTALGLGPARSQELDQLTGGLPLL
ncbi:MAG: peptidyl-tRNA hydrolase Pth2 [Methanomicrobiales archaeon]|nr:peptidyl-tRNA hydrolase Pth2 [Methanomicrobiales archaeon]